MTDRVLGRLKGSTTGDEYVEIRAVFIIWPQQMELSTKNVLVLVKHLCATQVLYGRWEGVSSVKLAHWICVHVRDYKPAELRNSHPI